MQIRSRRLSRLRQILIQLKDQPGKLLPVFLEIHPMVKGGVYRHRRRCGKPSCRCARGKLHESLVHSASISGRARLQSIAEHHIEQLLLLTQRYQRFRADRAKFVKLYMRMLRSIDEIERLRTVKP